MIILKTKRRPNDTKTDQLRIFEVITGLPSRTFTLPCTTAVLHHTPLWAGFQAPLLGNQEGADIERCVLGKLSRRDVSTADLHGTDTIPTVEISSIEIGPGVCDIQPGVYGTVVLVYHSVYKVTDIRLNI